MKRSTKATNTLRSNGLVIMHRFDIEILNSKMDGFFYKVSIAYSISYWIS